MIDRKEVELLIRANLKGGRDLDAITKSIQALEKALESQAKAAAKGEPSYDSLRASLDALKNVQEELAGRSKLLSQFESLAKKIDAANVKVDAAREKYSALADKLKAVEAAGKTVTDAQQQGLTKLQAALDRASGRLASYQQQQENVGEALRQAGVDTGNLARSQSALSDAALQTAKAVEQGKSQLVGYSEALRKGREELARFEDEQRKLARLQQGNENDARLGREQAANALAKLQQGNENDARLGREQQRLALLKQQTDEAEKLARLQQGNENDARLARQQATAGNLRDSGLRKTADDAEAAARQYITLATASTDLRPKVVSLREAIDSLINPTKAAVATLDGAESQIKAVAASIGNNKKSIEEYADQFRNLAAAQKAISGQAGLVDDFKKQQAALRGAREELNAAKAQVAQYAAAVRQGGDAGAAFTKNLAESENRLKGAAAALRDQIAAARAARDALRAVGIDTANLAAAEARLIGATKQATDAVKKLTEAEKQHEEALNRKKVALQSSTDGGRTTLSFMQRLRGEVLALTAAYTGLQGNINLAADAIRVSKEAEGLGNALAFGLGKAGDVAAEIKYLREQADRLGVSFEDASKGYAKFVISAVKSGAPLQEARFIFESFSEVARVINLTPDQLNGLFNAVSQSFSKGKIQAEELRQQIGERLPGAFAFAQQALKGVFPDLDKALADGKVGAENLLLIAESIRKAAADQLPTAIKSLDAEQQRFNNSVLFFKKEIADAGFADAYVKLLKELTSFLTSTDGEAFAKSLSTKFSAVVDAIRAVVGITREYGSEIKALATAAAFFIGIRFFQYLTTGALSLIPAITGVGTALTLLQKSFIGFQLAAVALNIGYYFYENENALNKFIRTFKLAVVDLREGLGVVGALLSANTQGIFKLFSTEGVKALDDRINEIRALAAKERESINLSLSKRRPANEGGGALRSNLPSTEVTAAPPVRPNSAKNDDKEIEKRARKIEALDNALDQLEARIAKSDTQSLAQQLDALELRSNKIQNMITDIGGKEGAQRQKTFDRLQFEERQAVLRDFNAKVLAERETLLGKIETKEAEAGRKDKLNLNERLDAIRESYAALYRDLEQQRTKALANGFSDEDLQRQKERLQASEAQRIQLERTAFAREELTRLETRYNDTLKLRDGLIAAVKAKQEANDISSTQAAEQINAINQQALPNILAALEATRAWAEANKSVFATSEDMTLFLANLDAAAAKARGVKKELTLIQQEALDGALNGVSTVVSSLIDSMGALIKKTGDWGDMFENVGKSILGVLASVLQQIAVAIIKQQILLAFQAITGTTGAGAGSSIAGGSGLKLHSGGVVGRNNNWRTPVDASWFANAPRYHSGGIAGLAPDEYAAVLKKNEEVLTTSDPRNVMNGSKQLNVKGGETSLTSIIVDDRARIPEAMASAAGSKVVLEHVKANLPTIRQWVRGG